jgi:hypothetical protein
MKWEPEFEIDVRFCGTLRIKGCKTREEAVAKGEAFNGSFLMLFDRAFDTDRNFVRVRRRGARQAGGRMLVARVHLVRRAERPDGAGIMKAAIPPGGRQHPLPVPTPVPPADPGHALIERVARDPSADFDKLQRLLETRAKAEADANERAFNDALAAAQAEMEPIRADAVNTEVGRPHRYASYAALDRAVRPIYTAHGLAVTFTTGERSTDTAVEVVAYRRRGLCDDGTAEVRSKPAVL